LAAGGKNRTLELATRVLEIVICLAAMIVRAMTMMMALDQGIHRMKAGQRNGIDESKGNGE